MVTVPALKLFAPMPDGVHSSSEQAAINGTAELGPYTQTDVEPLITARDVDLEEGSVNASSSGHIAMTLSSYMNDSPSTSSSGSNDNEANEPLVEAQDLKTAIIGKLENAGAKKVIQNKKQETTAPPPFRFPTMSSSSTSSKPHTTGSPRNSMFTRVCAVVIP